MLPLFEWRFLFAKLLFKALANHRVPDFEIQKHAASFLHSVERQPCDGYVIVPSRADAERAPAPRLDRPAVLALAAIPGLDIDQVLAERFGGGRLPS